MSWTPYFTLPAPQQGAYSPIAERGHRPRMECNSESSQSKQTLVRVTQPPSGQKALSSSPPPMLRFLESAICFTERVANVREAMGAI